MEINSPIIRFKDYVKEWKYFPLKDVLKVNSGRDYKHLSVGNIPVYGTGGYMLSVNSALSEQDAVGIGRKGTIDKPQLLKAPFWTVDTLFFMTPRENNNLFFLYTILQKINWKSHDESSGVPSLSKLNIEKINLNLPEVEEQKKIGEFFKNLDDSISIRQQELDILKQTKQGFLQKMFPKEGETVPEIRFAEFKGEWKEKKLGEIVEKAVDNRGKTPPLVENGEHPLLEVASLGKGSPDYSKVTKFVSHSTYTSWFRAHIKQDDILFSTVGNTGLISLMDDFEGATIAQNIVAFRAREGNDPGFLATMLQLKENLRKAKKIEMGAVQPSIKVSQLIHVEYLITENIKEQIKIGEFFKQLDKTIELQEKELEALKETKKAFLQKMFV